MADTEKRVERTQKHQNGKKTIQKDGVERTEIFWPDLSIKKKRLVISINPAVFLEQVINF